ncbi:MAG: NAD(P)H-dependent oxidoreductase [Holophagaceae bacterium]|jgi:nitroreductase
METILNLSNLQQALTQRYATKKFDNSRIIPNDTWLALESALVNTPSSFGIQPWKFIVVTQETMKRKLQPACYNQPQVVDASHFVIFAYRINMSHADIDRLIDRIVSVRGVTKTDLVSYRDMMYGSLDRQSDKERNNWNSRQCYIALGQFMLAASLVGVDTCPMEGIVPPEVDRILGLNELGYTAVVACAAGYRSPGDTTANFAKVRFPKEEVVITR